MSVSAPPPFLSKPRRFRLSPTLSRRPSGDRERGSHRWDSSQSLSPGQSRSRLSPDELALTSCGYRDGDPRNSSRTSLQNSTPRSAASMPLVENLGRGDERPPVSREAIHRHLGKIRSLKCLYLRTFRTRPLRLSTNRAAVMTETKSFHQRDDSSGGHRLGNAPGKRPQKSHSKCLSRKHLKDRKSTLETLIESPSARIMRRLC